VGHFNKLSFEQLKCRTLNLVKYRERFLEYDLLKFLPYINFLMKASVVGLTYNVDERNSNILNFIVGIPL
jgi:hypothetical protein